MDISYSNTGFISIFIWNIRHFLGLCIECFIPIFDIQFICSNTIFGFDNNKENYELIIVCSFIHYIIKRKIKRIFCSVKKKKTENCSEIIKNWSSFSYIISYHIKKQCFSPNVLNQFVSF